MPSTSSFYFSLHISPLHLRRYQYACLINEPTMQGTSWSAAEQLPRQPLDPLVSQDFQLGSTLTVPSAPVPRPCHQVCVWAWAVSGGKEVEPQFLDRIATCFAGPRGCGMSVCFCHDGAGRVMESINVVFFFFFFKSSLHIYFGTLWGTVSIALFAYKVW